MDFRKLIEEQRKNKENKEKALQMFDKVSNKIQSFAEMGAKKANDLLDTSKDYIDRKQAELENSIETRFNKSIYGDCIAFVDSVIVQKNVSTPTPVVIVKNANLENETNISIATIITAVAPKTINPIVYIGTAGYVENIYNAIITHFSSHPQLSVVSDNTTITITVKDVAPVEYKETEPNAEDEVTATVDEVEMPVKLDLEKEEI